MIVVSNSSPLITLARIGRLDLLQQLFGRVHIAAEVHQEVVVRGAGRPAADAVHGADWIEIQALPMRPVSPHCARATRWGLGNSPPSSWPGNLKPIS